MVMLSGARGGLGGTSGRRVTGMSQVSAMLMRPPEKRLRQKQRRATLSAPKTGRHEGTDREQLISQLRHRNPVFRRRPGPGDDPLLIEQRDNGTPGLRR